MNRWMEKLLSESGTIAGDLVDRKVLPFRWIMLMSAAHKLGCDDS